MAPLLGLLAADFALAGVITYSTAATQLCVGASGCGLATQTIGGAVTVSFQPIASSTVVASPTISASFGTLVVNCVGGGTSCGSLSLAWLNVYINIAQTFPTAGNASISGGVIAGAVSGLASSATITWSVANTVSIGVVRYSLASSPLTPPTVNTGRLTIQALVTDVTDGAAPTLSYSPLADSIVTLSGGTFRLGTATIAVSSAGAVGSGLTQFGGCVLWFRGWRL